MIWLPDFGKSRRAHRCRHRCRNSRRRSAFARSTPSVSAFHSPRRSEEGETLTLEIPVRGHVQVRVAEAAERRITLLTLAGHPIAGAVRFLIESRGDAVRFEIQVWDRPASMIDQLLMRAAGEWLQRAAWIALATNVARA